MIASPHLLDRLGAVFAQANQELFLVGGCVRDELLGRPSADLDLTTNALPSAVKHLVRAAGAAGLYTVGEKFGTIGAIFGEHKVEITTYRAEAYEPGSRRPAVTFGQTIAEDLARRDFTINAIARDLVTGQVIDPFDGRGDLAARTIRAVGHPTERFREDPLRLLRAVRFAAQLEFAIEPATRAAILAESDSLRQISRERIAEEMNKLLVAARPGPALRDLCDLGLMAAIIPEVLTMRGLRQEAYRYKDVFEHTLMVVDNAPPRLAVRWGALLHDISKPETLTIGPDGVHFHGHELLGERKTRRILNGLHFSREMVDHVALLVRLHLRANSYEADWTDGAVRRFMREAGDYLLDLFDLSRADVTSQRAAKLRAARERVAALEARCTELQAQADIQKLASPLDGNDLMALFDCGPGRWIATIKNDLLERVIDGTLAPDDRATATALAREHFVRLAAAGELPPVRPAD